MVWRATVEDMNTAQSVTESEHFDYDRERVLHDLSALKGRESTRPQSFTAYLAGKIKTLWKEQDAAQELMLRTQAPWLHRQ
jgi:hypothetical protein